MKQLSCIKQYVLG